jgi:hypothetical protein
VSARCRHRLNACPSTLEPPKALQELETELDFPKPSVQAIRPQVHQRRKDQLRKCGSVWPANSGRSPCARQSAGAPTLGLKFALGQFGARAQQAVVRPCIVVGEGTMGLNKSNTHAISSLDWPATSPASCGKATIEGYMLRCCAAISRLSGDCVEEVGGPTVRDVARNQARLTRIPREPQLQCPWSLWRTAFPSSCAGLRTQI